MANKFPYVTSPGPLVAAVEQLRKSFPSQVTAETLQKLGIAPNNESYIINTFRFLGIIDDEGKKDMEKAKVFLKGDDDFKASLATLVEEGYEDLFELHGEDAWSLSKAALTQFFRTADHTSDVVGKRQAATFVCLAGLAGHTDLPATRVAAAKRSELGRKKAPKRTSPSTTANETKREVTRSESKGMVADVGLTVRIEVNLPAEGDQATYDRIFQSIRKNLIDAES